MSLDSPLDIRGRHAACRFSAERSAARTISATPRDDEAGGMTIPCRAKRTLIAGLALAAGCLTTAPALAAAPANDDFANAASLGTAKALATPYTLDEATGQVFEQHPQGGLGNSVWYSWTAPTDGHVQVLACTANGTIYDRASVYEGPQLSALVWQSSVGPALCGAGSTSRPGRDTRTASRSRATTGSRMPASARCSSTCARRRARQSRCRRRSPATPTGRATPSRQA